MHNNYPIPRNILDGYDVAALMQKMAAADWYYDYTEDPHVWHRGNIQINDIKADLLQLSKMENGIMTANYLWDAYVPVDSVNRPCFLAQELQNNLTSFKNNIMNQDNLNYLKNNLKYSGFGDALNAELEKNISNKVSEFTLSHSLESNNRKMEANLHFKRGDQNEMYFFNKYDAKLTKADGTEFEQTFYMDKGKGFTLKEAANLLEGRSVNKDLVNSQGQEYNAWVKLDFENKNDTGNYERKMYHENFGYNLEKALAKHPIKELEDQTHTEELMRSLKKGNLQAVTGNDGERLFVAAEPESGKSNKVTLYDKNLREITVELRNVEQSQVKNDLKNDKRPESTIEKSREQKKVEKKKSSDDTDELLPKNDKKKGRGKAKGKENGDLLEKKKESTGKGMKF